VVREWDANPYAQRHGMSARHRTQYRGSVTVTIGGMTAEYDGHSFVALAIEDEPVIWVDMENGLPLVSAHIWDAQGATILRIDRGEWVYSAHHWDVTYEANLLTMREGRGRFVLQIRFAAPHAIHVTRARIYDGQRVLTITPDVTSGAMNFKGVVLSANREAALRIEGFNSSSLRAMAAALSHGR
jgi:hypothetical protein